MRHSEQMNTPLSDGEAGAGAPARGRTGSVPEKHFGYIDALRGYAILAVIAVHAAAAAPDLRGVGRTVVNQGARGVQLFFVASVLTLMISWHARNDGAVRFYIRRVFRIAPMFWLGIGFFLWRDGWGPRYYVPNGIGAEHMILSAVFQQGWHPEFINSIVHGGWSIAVEMTFYLIFPLLTLIIRGWVSALGSLVLTVIAAPAIWLIFWSMRGSLWPGLPDYLVATFLTLWFPSQLPVFLVGFVLYFAVRDYLGRLPVLSARLLLGASLAAILALAISPLPTGRFAVLSFALYAICFGVFAFCAGSGASKWLVSAPIRYIGKVSFSAYLWHFAILASIESIAAVGLYPFQSAGSRGALFFCGFFPYLVAATVLCSSVTYYLIEKPFIDLGNRLLNRAGKHRFIGTTGAC